MPIWVDKSGAVCLLLGKEAKDKKVLQGVSRVYRITWGSCLTLVLMILCKALYSVPLSPLDVWGLVQGSGRRRAQGCQTMWQLL